MLEHSSAEPRDTATPRLQLHSAGEAVAAGREAEASPEELASPGDAPTTAERRAARHGWLVERLLSRLAAQWPEGIDRSLLRSECWMALRDVAESLETAEDLPAAAALAIEDRLCHVLAGTEWYRQAVMTHVRPLLETWRGALLAGREPSDHLLSSRLHVGLNDLVDRFQELAIVFAVDPRALLSERAHAPHASATTATAETVGALPSEQQLTLSLYFQEELTYEQIGRVMDIPSGRAQELMGRAGAAVASDAALVRGCERLLLPADAGQAPAPQ